MAMKQSLQLRIGQQLSMTPQLQQAIKLLQLSTLDLEQEIQQALDSNMMLEVAEEESGNSSNQDQEGNNNAEASTVNKETSTTDTVENMTADIPDELPIDSSWEDVFDVAQVTSAVQATAEQQDFSAQRSKDETLLDHLFWQLDTMRFTERDHAIATAIIDSVNDDGYLSASVENIYQGLMEQLEDLEFDEVEAVLHRVQRFDPIGVAAGDLADCLTIQLLQTPESTPFRDNALLLVTRYLDVLAAHDQHKLLRKLAVNEQQLSEIVALIRTLDPKPGSRLQNSTADYVIPDVFVSKVKGKWQVSLNPDIAPKLRINPFYSGMIKRADNSEDNTTMKNHLQEAKWFIKSLYSRNDTLLRVGKSIVEKQEGFFDHGAIAMKPMVLRDIAEELELHESTISRVTTQKYMHTPNGIFELKYFFSSHVSTEAGGECSATAIKAFIKELVSNETPKKPLSDNKIAELLKEKGINVARRTVAKYREAMSIPSSSRRKIIL
jgi:RNA polymerase sigma-54 factor